MVKYLQILIFSTTILLISACQGDDGSNNPVITIPVDFNLDFSEKLNANRNGFMMEVETIKQYECENYEVDFQVLESDGEFEITLEDIVEPLDCIAGTGHAHSTIDLELGNNTSYELFINLKDAISNRGILTVSPAKYSVMMEDLAGINWTKSELLRVPQTFIWGYISYEGDHSLELVNNFYETIEAEVEMTSLEIGDYDYFLINENQELEMSTNALYDTVETFYFSYDSNANQLQEWVDKYNQNTENAQMSLSIFTDKGQVFQ